MEKRNDKCKLSAIEEVLLYCDAVFYNKTYTELAEEYHINHKTAKRIVRAWIRLGAKRKFLDAARQKAENELKFKKS